ncbi:MAG TPA: FAD-dependent monooxygenase [Ktedonobacterales bacterium]|jgi:2-polyprenyl-6-methoxyphenol hydroxylase-like FAD-dependent oxidoreductase
MRVLISGGGIAGLTLAYWLHQYAIPAVVIEQATGLRRDGYAIDFFGTGYDVARRMGLIDRLASQQIPLDTIAYVNRAGKPIATLERALLQRVTQGKYLGLMHWTLEEALYDALGGQVEVRFDRSLASIHTGADAVDVAFTDGTSESFDLLIGADGVHSLTRELVFGPEDRFSHFLGYMVASYPLADRYGIGRSWQMYSVPGRTVGAYVSRQEGEIITFFLYHQAEPDRLPQEQRLTRLRQVFAEMGWITPQLLADVSPSEHIFLDAVSQIRMPSWSQGRVALVGDACGCPTLVSGQGASLAMGGAYLLAEALREAAAYQEAFRRYEQRMRPHVQTQQKHARGLAKSFAPTSRVGILAQRLLLKAVLRDAFTGLLRRQFGAESLLQARAIRR